ncbi:uncharacterized protein [Nicotiana sylvestris]|uniref:Uncharacterized protein LOC104236460 n=1 Tax=Nicotiana sylvestris TaxID=4096 RepID=A0A1U7XG98_NICSY|nr:PREDICTED: uncharacterized protein LOC104236460 [Nicotiana sylvestris]
MASSNRDNDFINPNTSSPITVSDADSFLLDSSQIGSASGSFQNEGFLSGLDAAAGTSDAEFGFSRPDFRQTPLVGTVDFYDRHVFLCYKNLQVWPPRIQATEFDRLPRLLAAALSARKNDINKQTRLTICEGHDGTETSNGDVLIFPDMIRYRRLTHFDVDTFVEEVLVKDGEWLPGNPEALTGWYIFVCCHGSRDRRCGVCGPAIVSRLREEIEKHDLQGKISVSPCSHIGGHKFAGNVIIFGPNTNKEISGHWYGYVTPDDVPQLLEQHVAKGEIVDWLWRGQMGLSEDEQKASQEYRLSVNGGTYMGRGTKNSDDVGTSTCGSQLEGIDCCRANGNISCCQNTQLPVNTENFDLHQENTDFTSEKKKSFRRQISRSNSGKGARSRKVCSMPTWYESWEREDTYAVLAVIGAVVSVAYAFNCYRQLK